MKEKIFELISVLFPAFVGFVWWAGIERARIYTSIDGVKDSLGELLTQLDKRVDLHIQDSHHARDLLNEKISGQGRRFGAKFERVERYIEKLAGRKIDGEP